MVKRTSLNRSHLIVRLLVSGDREILTSFSCADEDLDDFVRSDALRLQEQDVVRTYVSFYGTKLVGYIALLTDAVVLETKERKRLALSSQDHPIVPAIKIARLGVSQGFRAHYRGAGEALVRFAFFVALDLAGRVGCRLLTVDAYPESVAFYERLGFVPNKAKVYQGKTHPSLRFDLKTEPLPVWLL